MKPTKVILLAACAIAGWNPHAQNLLLNGSFESPAIAPDSRVIGTPSSWQAIGNIRIMSGSFDVPDLQGPEDGQQYISIGNDGTQAAILQSVSIATPGVYTLAWFDNAGNLPGVVSPYSATVLQGATVIANVDLLADGSNPGWTQHTMQLNFVAGQYTIQFSSHQASVGGLSTLLDNIVLVGQTTQDTAPIIACPPAQTINCAPANGVSVTIQAMVTDPDAGQTLTLALKEGAVALDTQAAISPANTQFVSFNPVVLAPGEHLLTVEVSDGTESASCSSTVVVNPDMTPPTITCPDGVTAIATTSQGTTVNFSPVTATDDCSIPSITYSQAGGSFFGVGSTTVTSTATDAAMNQSDCAFQVNVVFAWSGVLQPVNADGSSVFKLGSTVPVKFKLTDLSSGITDAVATLSYAMLANSVPGPINEAVSTADATTGNLFRYDASSQQYIFNWSTKGLSVGSYELMIDFNDGLAHTVIVGLR